MIGADADVEEVVSKSVPSIELVANLVSSVSPEPFDADIIDAILNENIRLSGSNLKAEPTNYAMDIDAPMERMDVTNAKGLILIYFKCRARS